ncbi:hypothetical protein GCK32_002617 [Trichostrongylus colubriformis]|uniref:Uncharacterized protein n=1 Tax=Trichostrongylus colubriformis TaxID=6319 RepID=A0AAN8G7M5_TRICO
MITQYHSHIVSGYQGNATQPPIRVDETQRIDIQRHAQKATTTEIEDDDKPSFNGGDIKDSEAPIVLAGSDQCQEHDGTDTDFFNALSAPPEDYKRFIDPNYNYLDPDWMVHCEEILKRSRVFNERLRKQYGIVPEKYPVDTDTRPKFLRTPQQDSDAVSKASGGRSATVRDGRLRPPFTPYPGKTDKATRDLARMIVANLARPGVGDDKKFRVTSTISPIAGLGRPFNPIRLTRSEPTVTRASTIISRSELVATKAASATSCLASNLISLTHTASTTSIAQRNARSSSAHSRLTPQRRIATGSPTISDVVRFRNRIEVLSDFLRNPRHKPPRPIVRSNSDASTQQPDGGSTSSGQ